VTNRGFRRIRDGGSGAVILAMTVVVVVVTVVAWAMIMTVCLW
jgi:diacylglycerol kinase